MVGTFSDPICNRVRICMVCILKNINIQKIILGQSFSCIIHLFLVSITSKMAGSKMFYIEASIIWNVAFAASTLPQLNKRGALKYILIDTQQTISGLCILLDRGSLSTKLLQGVDVQLDDSSNR